MADAELLHKARLIICPEEPRFSNVNNQLLLSPISLFSNILVPVRPSVELTATFSEQINSSHLRRKKYYSLENRKRSIKSANKGIVGIYINRGGKSSQECLTEIVGSMQQQC